MDGIGADASGVEQQLAAGGTGGWSGWYGGFGGYGGYGGQSYTSKYCYRQCLASPAEFTGLQACVLNCIQNRAAAASNPYLSQAPE